MNSFNCPNCKAAISPDDPTYKRIVCANCRTIIDVPTEGAAVKPAGSSGSSVRNSAIRAAAPRTGSASGSGTRHVTTKSKSKARTQNSLLMPGIAVAVLFSIAAIALTRSKSETEASVQDFSTATKRESAAKVMPAALRETSADSVAARKQESAPVSAPTPESRRAVEVTVTIDARKAPAEQVATPQSAAPEKRVEVAARAATPVENNPPAAAATPPASDLKDLLKNPATREMKRDDDEALIEKEDAARRKVAEKAAAEKAALEKGSTGMPPEDPTRVKLITDKPDAPPAKPSTNALGMPRTPTVDPKSVAAPVPELPGVCPVCMGSGFVPFGLPRKLIRSVKDPIPAAGLLAPWKQCPKCKAGIEDQALADAEAARMKDPQTVAVQDSWSQMVGGKLEAIETRHVTLSTQLPSAQARVVADAIEQLTEHLQKISHVTVLTPTRPDTHELFLFTDRGAYEKIRDTVAPVTDIDKSQLAKVSGVSGRNKGLCHLQAQQKPEHMGLFLFGRMDMNEATDAKGPFWLVEGFAAYCENVITKKNLCYTISYELNEIKFSPDWNDDIRKYATKRQLKPWKDIFPATGALMKPLEYLTCYSMVSFLIKTDPQRFTRLVLAFREGHDSPTALKMAYGKDVDELQRMWAMWALTAR